MSDIEQVPSILTVIEDDPGEFIVRSSGEQGKRLAQGVLNSLAEARRVTVITDADVKVFKRPNGAVKAIHEPAIQPAASPRRQIVQDAAAPPSPEQAEDDYERMIREAEEAEAAQRRQDAFNSQPAVAPMEEEEAPAAPVKRTRSRQLDVTPTPNPCGRCGGVGTVTGDSGFSGPCPVCQGKGEIKAWGRGRRSVAR